MTGSLLQEDKLPPKLPFVLSTEIREQISIIDSYNQDKPDEVLQWNNYINWVTGYISNRSIAFDYANRYVHYRNGAIYLDELGAKAAWIIKYTSEGAAYVYIFKMNLNTDEFGLKLPVYETGNGICPRNNQLRNNDKIMNDLLGRIVKDELMRYNSNHILNETTDGKRVIRIDEDGIRRLLESASLRFLSVLESNNKTVTL